MAKRVVFNPFSGTLDYIDVYTPSVGGTYNVEKFQLSATDISNKQIVLSQGPSSPSLSRLIILTDNGGEQIYGSDFTVSGTTLTWNGLDLDGLLQENDKIVIVYN